MSHNKEIKDTKVFKFLKRIGKPVGGVLDFAGDITGIDALSSIGEAIKSSRELSEEEKALALEYLSLDVDDRKNARDLQAKAIESEDWFTRNFLNILASFIILAATAFGIMLFYVEVPEQNKRLVEMFADIYLFGGALMILQFFFGSSSGSKMKESILKKLK